MKERNGKLFVEKKESEQNICGVGYDPDYKNPDYYEYIKQQYVLGLKQFIVTSEIMMEIIDYYFIERKLKIESIEFMEEDVSLMAEIEEYIEQLNKDRSNIKRLLDRLEFIFDNESIDIEKITFIGRKVRIYILVNGIYGISEELYEEESNKLVKKMNEIKKKIGYKVI